MTDGRISQQESKIQEVVRCCCLKLCIHNAEIAILLWHSYDVIKPL